MANNQHSGFQIWTFSVQLSTSVVLFLPPEMINSPLVCVHTTLNKPIEIYFTGKFSKIEKEC